ncbi:MAG: hypothetical protein DRR19_06985 [Candidatus Parabeggiatoa sp. nov. 1]|nr:MAG: hypothetical protein DRR19_06985 [Gammaproteobacteria bacterium]
MLKEISLFSNPRQKLLQNGAQKLTDAELLAVLLGNGYQGKTALDLAQETLEAFENFPDLWKAGRKRFCAAVKGLGDSHYAKLQACAEITRRGLHQPFQSHRVLLSNARLKNQSFLISTLSGQDEEVFAGLFLDHKQQIVAFEKLFVGRVDDMAVEPDDEFLDEMLGSILRHQAPALIFAHYCPNKDANLKPTDHLINQWLTQTFSLLGGQMLDYLVIGNESYFSFSNI